MEELNKIHLIKLDLYNKIVEGIKELENKNSSLLEGVLDDILKIMVEIHDPLLLENIKALKNVIIENPNENLSSINNKYKELTKDDLEYLITDLIYWLVSYDKHIVKQLHISYEIDELLGDICFEEEIISDDYIETCWGDDLYLLKHQQLERLLYKLQGLKRKILVDGINIKEDLLKVVEQAMLSDDIGLVYVACE